MIGQMRMIVRMMNNNLINTLIPMNAIRNDVFYELIHDTRLVEV